MAKYVGIFKVKEADFSIYYKCITDSNHTFFVSIDRKSRIIKFFMNQDYTQQFWSYNLRTEKPLEDLKVFKLGDVIAIKHQLYRAWVRQDFSESLSKSS